MRFLIMAEENKSLVPSFKTMSMSSSSSTDQRSRSWKDLIPELLELILQKLTAMDYLKCRQICSSWRDTVDYALASKGRCPPKPQLPYLLTLSLHKAPTLLSLTQRTVFHMSPSKSADFAPKIQITSLHGWLMFRGFHYCSCKEKSNCCITFLFLNPVSGARFKLPPILFQGTWAFYDIFGVDFGFTPSSSEFLVAMLISGNHCPLHDQKLAFCKVNQDSWTFIRTVETKTYRLKDIAVHDNRLFAIAKDNGLDLLLTFSLDDDPNAIVVKQLVMLEPIPVVPLERNVLVKEDRTRHETNRVVQMLAVDNVNGELLLVFLVMDRAWNGRKFSFKTKGFHVYRLDLSSGPKWSEVKDLGDRFLFVDRSRVSVVSARGLDGAQEFYGGNCIFFCHANTFHQDEDDQFPNHDVGVFFLASKTIHHYSFDHALSVAIRDLWFSPSPW